MREVLMMRQKAAKDCSIAKWEKYWRALLSRLHAEEVGLRNCVYVAESEARNQLSLSAISSITESDDKKTKLPVLSSTGRDVLANRMRSIRVENYSRSRSAWSVVPSGGSKVRHSRS
jgi:hypothetical protein